MTEVFRKGDVVSIKGTIDYEIDGRAKVLFGDTSYGPSHTCGVEELTMVSPFFANGEMVLAPTGDICEVISVHEGNAWLRPLGGGYVTSRCIDLRLRIKATMAQSEGTAGPQTPPSPRDEDDEVQF